MKCAVTKGLMHNEFLTTVRTALSRNDMAYAIDAMRGWLASAQLGEPEQLISQCDADLKPRLVVLMRDVLSRFPHTLIGAPVLFFYDPEDDCEAEHSHKHIKLRLPFPSIDLNPPCAELHFMGWVSMDTKLPVQTPFKPQHHELHAPSNQIHSAVALFKSHPDVFDLDEVVLDHVWWSELFRDVNGLISLSARFLLPYPDAIEASRILYSAARNEPCSSDFLFLSNATVDMAKNAAALFRETCMHQFPHRLF